MALVVRPQPFSREVDRLFDAFFGAGTAESGRWVPAMDLWEADEHFVLKADLPGLSEEDVTIEVQDGALAITGERHEEDRQDGKGWYRFERSFGKFSRTLTLPEGVDPDGITAEFNAGVLEVRIPKPEQRKPRRVEVKAGARPALEGTAEEK
ncbi:MAG: Hsp20/alpha crystallin family protein [Thermoleophilaceae bacterium]|nr:Hsp20/alpha crystallin family protein [Thermoleophilaceae bacterium]